jgi:hypothetical protein
METTKDHAAPGTDLAVGRKRDLPPEAMKEIELRKIKNQVAQQIRGTAWGKDLDQHSIRAVAEYCRENGLDAVRHVEILGGRIYLTAEFYRERGAPLIRRGVIRPEEPDMITADQRLDDMAKAGNGNSEWAKLESERRARLRIQYGVPEGAKAAAVVRFRLNSGATVIGVNWCGGTAKRDPVGDAEPTKTAITRAERRAWRQVADVLDDYGHAVHPLEMAATEVEVVTPKFEPHQERALLGTGAAERDAKGKPIPEVTVIREPAAPAPRAPVGNADPYGLDAAERAADAEFQDDTDLVDD